ncbi:hypothetical protein SCHPADRAFT_943498 [Schizopora paradoxa]|uniref:F-box domain-containing protein n=1 Tax=Schizopora paradoxa TaxID=27342 RepID=A0A0H2RCX8_9AGAM|nr:hypothetical protein SCHPADRAFT_943498 [Schizopora paradoxa]
MSSRNVLRESQDEPVDALEAAKIRVVEDIGSLVLSSFDLSFKLPQHLEEEEQFLNSIAYDELLKAGVQRNDGRRGFTLVSRSRTLLQRLECLRHILTGVTSSLDLKIQHAQRQADRMGSICGLAALPSEVLCNIFSFAVHGFPSDGPRSLVSMRLSHVCRHFRDLMLANPRFWTEIRSTPRKPELGLVEACIQRSKKRPLDIHLNLYTSKVQLYAPAIPPLDQYYPNGFPYMTQQKLECDEVLSLLVPHIERWRSLHLHYVDGEGFSGSTEIFERLEGSLFPILETIAEYHDQLNKDGSDRDMRYIPSWNTPALSNLIVYDCLPRSIVSTASFETFHAELFALSDVVEVLDSLNEMQSLSELYIDISKYQSRMITKQNVEDLKARHPIVLENVKKFTFCFASHHAADEVAGGLERLIAIFSKLQAPNATHVRLEGRKSDYARYFFRHEEYPLNLHQLLSDFPVRFPNVVNCKIIISRDSDSAFHNTTFPIQFPSSVEYLTFMCNTSLFFPGEDAKEAVCNLGRLRSLTLGINSKQDTFFASYWLRWMADNVRLHGGWQSFERFVFLRCEERDNDNTCKYEEPVYKYEETVPRDNFIEWCNGYDGSLLFEDRRMDNDGYNSDW